MAPGSPWSSLCDLEEESFHFEQFVGYLCGYVGDCCGPQDKLRLIAALNYMSAHLQFGREAMSEVAFLLGDHLQFGLDLSFGPQKRNHLLSETS